MECRFCSVNEERQRIIWRGTYVYAMLSNPEMQVDLQILVIPYLHVAHLSDLPDEEYWELSNTARMFQKKIRESGPDFGCDFRQHDRPFMRGDRIEKVDGVPTKMDHVHIHLILRSYNDRLYQEVQAFEKFTIVPPEAMRRKEESVKHILFPL